MRDSIPPSGSRASPPGRLAGQLVGREGLLERFELTLDHVDSNRARFLDLVGEPGIGKTRLLAEICELGEGRGMAVFRGRAAQLETEIPFALFAGAFDDYLASLNPRVFKALTAEHLSELSAVFPATVELAGPVSQAPSEERYLAHRAVRALLELLGGRKPMLLCLDDLHWADEASLELVDHLLRHPPRAPVLFAVARRTGALDERWESALESSVRDVGVERIEVGPLAREDADALLPGLKSDAVERIWKLAGGNPFYLEQLGANPEAAVAASAGADEVEGVPAPVAAALRDELAVLSDDTRLALGGAAVVGDPFEVDLAAAAADIGERELLAALDEASQRRIVGSTSIPRQFRFRHPIVARAVYEGASPGWRIGAHRRAARALERRGAPALSRAPHVEFSAEIGDRAAIDLLTEAGAAVAARAPAAAARWFGSALRLLPERAENRSQRLALMVPMARALAASGRLAETRRTLREVLESLPPEAFGPRVEVASACATTELFLGRHREAGALIGELLAGLSSEQARERATLKLVLASIGFWNNEWDLTTRHAGEARAAARESGHAAVESAATSLLAMHAARLNKTPEAMALTDRAAALIESLTDAELAERLDTMAWLAGVEFYLERTEAALRHSMRALGVARSTGQAHLLPLLANWRDWSLYWQGRVAEARDAFEESIEVGILSGNEFGVFALAGQTDLAPCWAEPPVVSHLVERTLDAADSCRGRTTSMIARMFAARALLRLGDHEGARRETLAVGDGPDLEGLDPAWRPMAWVVLTRCELIRGDLAAARRYAARAEGLGEAIGLPVRVAYGFQARALVELGSRRFPRAVDAALAAADRFAAGGMRIEVGISEALAARALAAGGDVEGAAIRFDSALERFNACGATRLVDEVARELRKLGHRVARPGRRADSRNGEPALSDREREVAELVAEGQTNKEIAAALFISPKTVEKHLGRVFQKLGVSKRSAVGARLAAASSAGDVRESRHPRPG